MATKQSSKGGSGEQKKVAASSQEAKEKNPPKDEKTNAKAVSKDNPKDSKDTVKKPNRDVKRESGQGGGHDRNRSSRQNDHSRSRDRSRRNSRDRHDHKGQGKDDREVCRNFLHNRCDRGSQCKYYHPRSSSRSRHDDPGDTRGSPTRAPMTSTGQIICRDFLRNMCSRGDECRFYHPPSEDSVKNRQNTWLTLCHDFRNGHCLRSDCRFFHITRDDEESYRATGDIPLHIIDQAVRKAMVLDAALIGTRPTCKEFLRGLCNMQNCRFRHLSQREYEDEVFHALQEEFESILGPPDRHAASPPQVNNPYPPMPNFHGNPQGDFREDVMPPDDMRGPMMPMPDFEPEPKRPRYFSGDGMFPGEEYRDGPNPPRKWDEQMDYERMDRPDVNPPQDPYHPQAEIYALRNENLDILRNAEREINELKEEVRRALDENAKLHHEVAKIRATATEESLLQKSNVDKLTLTNNTLMENIRKSEEASRRLEHDNREKLKALDAKQKSNTAEFERKINNLQKEASQLRDALSKANNAQKKSEDERARLLSEVDDLRMKMRNQSSSQSMRKDSQQHGSNSNYNNKNAYPRDAMKDRSDSNFDMMRGDRRLPDTREQDIRGMPMRGGHDRGHERYSPDVWGDIDKNGRPQYEDKAATFSHRGGGSEGDRTRSWHGGQDSWPSHGGQGNAPPGPLMGEFQNNDRMNPSLMRGSSFNQGGAGMLNMPMDRPPQAAPGGQMGMEGQFSGQGRMSQFEERDYSLSGYDNDRRGDQFGHSQRSSTGWAQGGGDGVRGQGISQSWRRDKAF